MTKARRIGVAFLAKLLAVSMAFLGLIAGVIYSVGGAAYDILTTHSVNSGTALAFLALLGMPVAFGAAGFLLGAICALLYNLASRWFGGIEMDIQSGARSNRS